MLPRRNLATVYPTEDDPTGSEAATPEQIAALPRVHFTVDLFDDPRESCAVCLAEFSPGDVLQRLPCGHHFHRCCAGTWLARSKKCPLCMGTIDSPSACLSSLRSKVE